MEHSDLRHGLLRRRRIVLGTLAGVLVCAGVAVALFVSGIIKLPTQESSNSAKGEQVARPLETQASATPSDGDIVAVLNTDTRTLAIMTWLTKRTTAAYSPIPTWWNADPGAAFTSSNLPGWTIYRDYIDRVVFEGSVAPTNTAYWFAYLENLTTIERMASNLDTRDTVNMDGMFLNCSQLPDAFTSANGLDVSSFAMNKVRSARAMFSGCSIVSQLDLASWSSSSNSTSKITDWGSMFAQCSMLTSIQGLDRLDTSSAVNMSYMFADCKLISQLNLYDWDTTQVSNSRCMFYRCAALGTLRLGPKSANLDTGAGVLDGCFIPPSTTVIV